ncbi:hypothetical protein R6Q57_023596 [Mikania cordata]
MLLAANRTKRTCPIELIGSCRNKVQVYRSVRMPQLHTSLHFHLTPIVMIKGSSRRDHLLNSQNFCRSIPAGAENPSLSRLCYWRLWGSRNRRALILGWAYYLDAVSSYPLRTWLPSVYRGHDNWYTRGTVGSQRPTFVPARRVGLVVKLPSAFAFEGQSPSGPRKPLHASVSYETGAGFSKKPRSWVAKRAYLETWDLSRKCEASATRIFDIPFYFSSNEWHLLLEILAILSMILGNLIAITQTSMKRMLAYSSIGQIGYVIIGIIVGDSNDGYASMITYMLFYISMNLGTFACIVLFGLRTGTENIRDYAGLYTKDPFLALSLALCLLSLGGLPPLADRRIYGGNSVLNSQKPHDYIAKGNTPCLPPLAYLSRKLEQSPISKAKPRQELYLQVDSILPLPQRKTIKKFPIMVLADRIIPIIYKDKLQIFEIFLFE